METNLLKTAYHKHTRTEMPVLMEVSSWEVIARLVEEGLGVGFFPDYVALEREGSLKPYPLKLDPIEYKIYAIVPRTRTLHRNIEMFISSFLQAL